MNGFDRAILDQSFAELFARYPGASQRIRNLILRAADDGYVALPSVLEYWEDRDGAQARLHGIDGFGPKAINETQRFIRSILVRHP